MNFNFPVRNSALNTKCPFNPHLKQRPEYLLSIELVELGLRAISTPQTQDLGLRTVGHVDELLVPPAFINGANATT